MRDIEKGDFLTMKNESYGFVLYEVVNNHMKCNRCGEDDGIVLQIVCNNNFGFDSSLDELTPYNHKKGITVTDCFKNLCKDIRANKIKLLNENEKAVTQKQLLDAEDN